MSGLILETETESITFGEDGRLLHTHKTTFAQRRSLNTWPDFQSAKKAVEADLGQRTMPPAWRYIRCGPVGTDTRAGAGAKRQAPRGP
jgi:hypothetical protein